MSQSSGEFSCIIDLEHILHNQGCYSVDASLFQREALSKRFSIKSIELFSVNIEVSKNAVDTRGYFISGNLSAKITQKSIVSLQDVPENIDLDFAVRVFDRGYQEHILEEQENEQDIELSDDDKIDIGEIAAQYLLLAINPYPRLEGEKFDSERYSELSDSPFAELQKIRDKE
jgi:uncharacterized metal-binding protein YceD (DUF177 family)